MAASDDDTVLSSPWTTIIGTLPLNMQINKQMATGTMDHDPAERASYQEAVLRTHAAFL